MSSLPFAIQSTTLIEQRPKRFVAQIMQSAWLADDVISIELRATDNSAFPPWEPGAHVDLFLPSGRVRQYSLCGDPEDLRRYQIAVLRNASGRGGSVEIHDTLRVGQTVELASPRNNFRLLPAAKYLFVAGGIGITPILPMIRQVAAQRLDWQLVYGARSARNMPFAGSLRLFGSQCVRLCPFDLNGPIDIDAVVAAAASGVDVYACGPQSLLDVLDDRFAADNLTARLHMERFTTKLTEPSPNSKSFRIFLARTGGYVDVPPGCTIVDALRQVGVSIPTSCEQGFCGTCETAVLGGCPDHRDTLLSETERASGKVMLPCVSRALTKELTLDI